MASVQVVMSFVTAIVVNSLSTCQQATGPMHWLGYRNSMLALKGTVWQIQRKGSMKCSATSLREKSKVYNRVKRKDLQKYACICTESFARIHNMLALGQWGDFPGDLDSKESTCNAGDHLQCR